MEILKKIIQGLVTSMGVRVVAMGLRFLTICIFPIWLSPGEIGYMAIILALVNVPGAFADLGLGTALIKEKEASEAMYDAVFLTVVGTSTSIAAGLLLSASALESAFSLPAIFVGICAFAIPFHALAIVPNSILQKELRFNSLAVRDLLGEIAFSGTAIALSACEFGAFSIALAVVVHRFVRWIVASVSISWAPRLRFSIEPLRRLASFSAYQFISLSLTQIFYQIDKLLLAAWLSPVPLGLYSQAQQITVSPVQTLSNTAKNVFFASFAKVQDDEATLRMLFSKTLKGMLVLSGAATAVIAPAVHLVPLVYGDKWVDAIPIALTMCCFLPVFGAFLLEGIMIAIGGEKRRIVSTATQCILLTGGIVGSFVLFPERTGPITVAVIWGIAATTCVLMNLYYIMKRLHIRTLRPYAPALAICLVLSALGLGIGFGIGGG